MITPTAWVTDLQSWISTVCLLSKAATMAKRSNINISSFQLSFLSSSTLSIYYLFTLSFLSLPLLAHIAYIIIHPSIPVSRLFARTCIRGLPSCEARFELQRRWLLSKGFRLRSPIFRASDFTIFIRTLFLGTVLSNPLPTLSRPPSPHPFLPRRFYVSPLLYCASAGVLARLLACFT